MGTSPRDQELDNAAGDPHDIGIVVGVYDDREECLTWGEDERYKNDIRVVAVFWVRDQDVVIYPMNRYCDNVTAGMFGNKQFRRLSHVP